MAELKYKAQSYVARAPLLRGLAAVDSDETLTNVQLSAVDFEALLIDRAGEDFTDPQPGQRLIHSDASPEDGLENRSVADWVKFVLDELRDVPTEDRYA